ncbi:MAG: hypothetical protein M1834_003508 [Cirrosporium novae-zelandiae]|nr:MAG: hypothetical protein M1834_003508 [Cirrosporium novae-zelandiae]
MNLGSDLGRIKTVNSSRPELLHTESKQSITASEDYYSAPDNASHSSSNNDNNNDNENNDSRTTIIRYATPQSQYHTPYQSTDHLQSSTSVASPPWPLPDHQMTEQSEATAVPRSFPLTVRFVDMGFRQAQRPTSIVRSRAMSGSEGSAPTPGVDDTPYIRFAIDQLTRDEELMGRGRNGSVSTTADFPVNRIRDDQSPENPTSTEPIPANQRDEPEPPLPPLPQPESELTLSPQPPTPKPEILVAIEDPESDYRHLPLTFVPGALQPVALLILTTLCLLMIAALIFCNLWSVRHAGLWKYHGVSDGHYFVFEFLPQILGMIIVLWVQVVQNALYRITPFLTVSRYDTPASRSLPCLSLFPTRFLVPDLSGFANGQFLLGTSSIVFWLSYFTIPLQSAVFQTKLYNINGQGFWYWTTVRPVAWTLVALYILLVANLLCILFAFWRRRTGLKWDPTSLADIIVIMRSSNILHDYDQTETAQDLRGLLPERHQRLGYWATSDRGDVVSYSLSEENAPLRRRSLLLGKLRDKLPLRGYYRNAGNFDVEQQRPLKSATAGSFQADIHSSSVRYRFIPWYLRETFVVAWMVMAAVLVIAFVVVSFVKQAVEQGFLPRLPSATDSQGVSPSNLLFSFLPSLLGMILFLAWQSFDMAFRSLQPFARLASPDGAEAEKTVLLGYTHCLPIEVTIRAALAGDFRVALISLNSLLSSAIPILAGGVFTAQFHISSQTVLMTAQMPSFYVLVVFTIIYALSTSLLWPTRKRYLPHSIRTIPDLISFLYQSPLLNDTAFRDPISKTDLVTRLLAVPRGETAPPKYAFGVYRGRDGKEHLGVDRLERPGSPEMLVVTGTMK